MILLSRIICVVVALGLIGCAVAVLIGYTVTWNDVSLLVLLGAAGGWLGVAR